MEALISFSFRIRVSKQTESQYIKGGCLAITKAGGESNVG